MDHINWHPQGYFCPTAPYHLFYYILKDHVIYNWLSFYIALNSVYYNVNGVASALAWHSILIIIVCFPSLPASSLFVVPWYTAYVMMWRFVLLGFEGGTMDDRCSSWIKGDSESIICLFQNRWLVFRNGWNRFNYTFIIIKHFFLSNSRD